MGGSSNTMPYVVGIDLGTTHTVVAFADLERPRELEVFPVVQRVSATATEARPLLPSALYAPLPGEADDLGDWVVGEWARARGAEVPARVVTSSKSWLAHPSVDRQAPILPWGVDEEGPRLSPVEAAARVLSLVREAWDEDHPGAPLRDQDVLLTVPASFDEVARTLTLEAARQAGLSSLRLLEEPQAAFLDWARRVGDVGLLELLPQGVDASHVLVCDVGGGTTDLSLVRVSRDPAAPAGLSLTRVAVGDHLLLGGDNLDLALAHRLEPRLSSGSPLPPSRFAQLALACRSAKERLLSSDLAEVTVTLLGSGSRLVSGALRTTLARAELDELVEGFFPVVTRAALQAESRPRAGLVAFGLPYASDPAVTRHLARFLATHLPEAHGPVSVLLNGGVFHAASLVERVREAIATFSGAPPRVLAHRDPDLAVSRGAVAHGLSLRGLGRRVGGGSAHGYYVGIAPAGGGVGPRAVCVVPRGAEAGDRHAVARTFQLLVGRGARFELFSSDRVDEAGAVVAVDEAMTALPPLATSIAGTGGEVRVALEGELTEVGTLEVACVEVDDAGRCAEGARRHRLAFELRRAAGPSTAPPTSHREPRLYSHREPRLDEARVRIDRVFGKAQGDVDPREARNLLRELERVLGERGGWPTSVVRPLYDHLRSGIPHRRRSADHERAFWSLAGFLLRPGFGDPQDHERVAELEPLFAKGLTFPNEPQSWRAWWVAWRRIAGGLGEPSQAAIRDLLDPFLQPPDETGRPRRRPKQVRAEPLDEVLYLASSLERVPALRRAALGAWILERTWTSNDPSLYAALGRLGARVPAYASAHHVVSPRTAEAWLSHLLRADWNAIPTAPFAAVQVARRTGDRARDVSEATRAEVVAQLTRHSTALGDGREAERLASWKRLVLEVVEVDDAQRRELFGEALPLGLRLVD